MCFKSTRENITMSTAPVYTYTYDHIHVRTKDPEGMAGFFETMFGATVLNRIQSDGVPRVDLDVNGQSSSPAWRRRNTSTRIPATHTWGSTTLGSAWMTSTVRSQEDLRSKQGGGDLR